MFDLVGLPTVWIEVKWPGLMPGPDEGLAVQVEHMIEVEVEIVERAELLILFPGDKPVEDEVAVFKRLAKGWRKFNIGGQRAEFSDENVLKILAFPMFSTGFELAYMRAWQGKGEVREKNSKGSPESGRAGVLSAATGTTSSSAIAADSA